MTKIPRLMTALGAALIALLIAGAALAQTPGHDFFGRAGDVTVDGNALTDGMTINAWVDGAIVDSGVVGEDRSGEWRVTVPARHDGSLVTFSVGDAVNPDASWPVRAQALTPVTPLALTTPSPEPEPEEPATDGDTLGEDGDSLQGEGGDDSMMDEGGSTDDTMGEDGDSLQGEGGDDSMMDEGGSTDDTMGEDGDSLQGEGDDGTTGDELQPDGSDDGSGDDSGDGMPVDILDENPPTDDSSMGTGDGSSMSTDGEVMNGDADMIDESAMGTDDDTLMDGSETVGGITGPGSTGTGGLADSGSSAALWASIGSALALATLLTGGFALRRRRAQS